MKSLFKSLFYGLCVFLVLVSCSQKPQPNLRIGAVLWPGYEPLYLASKLGYFDKHPIKIVDYLSNTDAMLAFKNRNLDAGAFTLDETLQLLSEGNDIEIILIMDISHGGDVILANADINNVSDLKGKPVAVESSAVGAFVLKRALELNNMDISDIQIISTNAMEQVSSFEKGQIVAAVSFDPYRTQLAKAGKKEIFNSTLIPNEIFDVLVVRKSYAQEHPETVQQLVDAWFRALDYQSDNPAKSAEYSLKRFNTNTEEYIASLKLLRFANREDNKKLLDATNSPLLNQQHKMIRILQELELINATPRLEGHLNPSYIR
ncbi:MAG: nitrate ABC transporter substrate-binding protein [Gammaproteobacteria bacterium]|nr:MAG: nitrate ABC transporter substrate-binding protein [Gammaproteobacteria bacterium]